MKFLPQYLLKSYKKKILNHLVMCTPTVLDKIPIASDGEYCIFFLNIGGGAVWPLGPLLHEAPPPPQKKNSSRIIPCISGKIPASHTLDIGAFMTKHVKIQENTNTNRLGMESECIICIRFYKKKNQTNGEDPPFARVENSLDLFIY